jgi:hypothetical protein
MDWTQNEARVIVMRKISALALMMVVLTGNALGAEVTPQQRAPARSDKRWAQEPAEFLSEAREKQWVIGRSTTPCLSSGEATQQACRDGARQVAMLLYPVTHSGERQWASEQLYAELTRGEMVRDRSVTRVVKPYGELWSAMILVDASPGRLRAIAAEHVRAQEMRQRTSARQWMAFAGLFASILAIYAVLNALTKGYFRGRLRAITVVSLAALACGMIGLLAAGAQGSP